MAISRFDNYDILKLIGGGAFSNVYKVCERKTRKRFAIKHVVVGSPESELGLAQLENEHRLGHDLDHPNIARIYDLVEQRRRRRVTEAYLVMELVRGAPMQENARLYPFERLLFYFRQVANGLAYMHERGVLHTDIKPKNLMITSRDLVKIVDLGQATTVWRRKGRVQGTFEFMAPEQVYDEALDARTDIYNLAATMYFMLSGRYPPPLIEATRGDRDFLPGRSRRPPSIQGINPRVTPALDDLLRISCSRARDDRPPTMQNFIERLEGALDG